CARLWDYFDYW
nr:immunoglobulin heavy chain junction region [Mus musculus]